MAIILNTSINLSKIPKDKIIEGKKGKYLPISVTVNDELNDFGNQGHVTVGQSKEERDSKQDKTFLGDVRVGWTNGATQKLDSSEKGQATKESPAAEVAGDDLPF